MAAAAAELRDEVAALREQQRVLAAQVASLAAAQAGGGAAAPSLLSAPRPLTGVAFLLVCLALLAAPSLVSSAARERGADHPLLRDAPPAAARRPSSCCARSLNTTDVRAGSETSVASIFGSDTFAKWSAAAALASKNVNGDWKRGEGAYDGVRFMLEHVTRGHAERYLEHVRALGVADADIQRLVALNDARGGATLEDFAGVRAGVGAGAGAGAGGGAPPPPLRATGASLRYLYHALLIVNHAPEPAALDVVEVGGGYGGFALMLDAVLAWRGRALRSYRIYDLGGPRLLQMAYLEAVDAGRGVFCWGDSSTSGNDVPADCELSLLTSAYAISEFPDAVSDAYLKALAGRAAHAFFAWNSPRRSPFLPAGYKEWVEDPLTGDHNRLIIFR
jgi:hypothetical protein